MKILICTGIYPPDIGGPALYAENLYKQFEVLGHDVRVASYRLERKLPTVIRHLFYFFKIILKIANSDLVLILDTFSVGLPAVLAGKLFRKKTILRIGGDFLWEMYLERGGKPVALENFYKRMPKINLKEKFILNMQKFIFNKCTALVFTTPWQRDIFLDYYKFNNKKAHIIDNYFGDKIKTQKPEGKVFLYAGRQIKLKNVESIKNIFTELSKSSNLNLEIVNSLSHDELIEKMKSIYAVILPSYSEVSPNFIIDALSLNKPFILTKECGYKDRLKDLGLFIDPFNKEDIKNKVFMMADSENYDKFRKNIENFNYRHSWQDMAREFVGVYKKI